jgi:hypothetical protein
MGKRAVAISLGLTYCIAMVAWCLVLIKAATWLSGGIAVFADSVHDQARVVISGRSASADNARPVLVHRGGDDQRARLPIWW